MECGILIATSFEFYFFHSTLDYKHVGKFILISTNYSLFIEYIFFSSKFDILTFAICCYNLRQWKNVNKSSPSILQHNQHDDILPNHVCYKIMQHNILLNLQTLNFVCLLLQYIFFIFFILLRIKWGK